MGVCVASGRRVLFRLGAPFNSRECVGGKWCVSVVGCTPSAEDDWAEEQMNSGCLVSHRWYLGVMRCYRILCGCQNACHLWAGFFLFHGVPYSIILVEIFDNRACHNADVILFMPADLIPLNTICPLPSGEIIQRTLPIPLSWFTWCSDAFTFIHINCCMNRPVALAVVVDQLLFPAAF